MGGTRIAICGTPRAGKSEYAKGLGLPVYSTDDLIEGRAWSEASAAAARWFDMPGPWVIEGVAVCRSLRKWMAANDGRPCDELVMMWAPWEPLTPEQITMAKGIVTVFEQISPELARRGVALRRLGAMWGPLHDRNPLLRKR